MNWDQYAFFDLKKSTRNLLIDIVKWLKRIFNGLITIVMLYVFIKMIRDNEELSMGVWLRFLSLASVKTLVLQIILCILEYFEEILSLELPHKRGHNIPVMILICLYRILEIFIYVAYVLPYLEQIVFRTRIYEYTLMEYLSLLGYYFLQPTFILLVVSCFLLVGIKYAYMYGLLLYYKKTMLK